MGLSWSERMLQINHKLDDSGLCACGLSPCPVRAAAQATQADVRALAKPPRDVTAERLYRGLIDYEDAAADLGPQANSGP